MEMVSQHHQQGTNFFCQNSHPQQSISQRYSNDLHLIISYHISTMTSSYSGCFACQIMQEKTSLHNSSTFCDSQEAFESSPQKFNLIHSTNDSLQGNENYGQSIPKDSEMKAGDPSDFIVEELAENIETPGEEGGLIQLLTQPSQTKMKRKRQRGARPKKGRDLDTFFPQMRRSITKQTQALTHLPPRITFKLMPQVIRHFTHPIRNFLMQQIDKNPPQLATTQQMRKIAHKQKMFKKRAQQIMNRYFRPIWIIPQ